MFSDSQNCAWMREGARSLIYPRCVTNASQFYIPQDQELPVPSEQCPEPQAGTFVTELTTQIRSSQWQALMNRLLWNQRAAWPTSHLSSKISAFLLLYGLLGKTKKKHTQTLKEIYLLYRKQISLCAKIDAVIDMQEKSPWIEALSRELEYCTCFKIVGLQIRKTSVELLFCTPSCVTLGKLLNHSESQFPNL